MLYLYLLVSYDLEVFMNNFYWNIVAFLSVKFIEKKRFFSAYCI